MTVPKRDRDTGLLDALDVARVLNVHRNTVMKIPPSELPYARIGARGDRRYSREDVNAYISDRMER